MDTTVGGIERARKNLIEVLGRASKAVRNNGVKLLLEPQCRFEGYYGVNSTVSQTIGVINDVAAENIDLMLDTFHSNIEEVSVPDAVREAGGRLAHVHAADSNRLGPGFGSIDFKSILRSLKETGYRRYLCLECVPAGPDPDGMCLRSLQYLKSLEAIADGSIGEGN
jgi:sugar phosphate isomerase/epimerase